MNQSFLFENRLIYQHTKAASATAAQAEAGVEPGEPISQEKETPEQKEARLQQEKLRKLAAMQMPDDIRAEIREAIFSENPEKRSLADRVLKRKLNIDGFRREYEEAEKHEKSWKKIMGIQRKIRQSIAELYERTESYGELVPSQREVFSRYSDYLCVLNGKDLKLDNQLKSLLLAAMTNALISEEDAKKLYELNPADPNADFEQNFRRLTENLKSNDRGKQFVKQLTELKEQERYIENQFQYYFNEVSKILQRLLITVMWKGERDRMLEHASRTCGITLKEGVKILYREQDEPVSFSRTQEAIITKIDCEEKIPVFGKKGEFVTYDVGMPKIILQDKNGLTTYTLARFKKWIDKTDAVEADVKSLEEVHRKIGWDILHLELKPGLQLEYQRFDREQNGKTIKKPQRVHITKIENGAIFFNQPVLYKSAFLEEDLRESLTFSEFVKWYFTNEVERDFAPEELKQSLKYLNQVFNKNYKLTEKENPPIEVLKNEILYYPDGSGMKFKIERIENNQIHLDNGEVLSFPQFFNWVKNNNVKKLPKKEEPEKKEKEAKKEELETKPAEEPKKHEEHEEAGSTVEYLKKLWFTTTFLSFKDIWNMVISVKEFVQRKHKRRSQGRYGQIGSVLPGVLGAEFDRIRQAAENEEVHLNEQAMEHWGIFAIKDRMHETVNRDVAKACVMTLVKKGEMRWDDHRFWETLNRLTARHTLRGAELYINPHPRPGESPEDKVGPAIDALWGQGTYTEWFQKNISTYNNNKNNFEYKGKQLEGDPKGTGGLKAEIHRLLIEWKRGEYVNPQEYEELIDFAIKYGKMSAEQKMFYIIAGLITKNPKYEETLLHLDRPGELNGKYLNIFPLLDYFVDKGCYKESTGRRNEAFRASDYEYFAKKYFPDDLEKGKPGVQFSKFLWHVMIMNDNFRTRLSKGLRSAENMDHDDAHIFVPPSSMSEIESITSCPAGGAKTFFTTEGYANVYPGFSQYLITLANLEPLGDAEEIENVERKRKQALKDTIKSFVRFDSIISNRFYKKEGDRRARLLEHHFERECVIDKGSSIKLSLHRDQLQNLIKAVGKAYGMDFSYLYRPHTGSLHDPAEAAKQEKIEKEIENFNIVVDKLFEEDNGEKIIRAIKEIKDRDGMNSTGLRGIRGWPLWEDSDVVNTAEGLRKAKDMGLL